MIEGGICYPLVWRVKTRLPERNGQRCRVLKRSLRMNSALVEFEDGYQVVTSRNFAVPVWTCRCGQSTTRRDGICQACRGTKRQLNLQAAVE